MMRAFEEFHRSTRMATLLHGLVMVGMSIALIIIGSGMVKYRRWASGAAVTWGIAGLVVIAATFVMNIVVLGPAMERLMEEMMRDAPVRMNMGGMMKIGLYTGPIINAVWPILLIVTFRKPHIVEAMKN